MNIHRTLLLIFVATISVNSHAQSHSHKTHAEKKMHQNHDSNTHKKHMNMESKQAEHVVKFGTLIIEDAMTRETPPGTSVGAGYLTITNNGKDADTLVSLSTNFSEVAQIHEMKMNNNIMSMKEIKSGLIIKAGESVTLKPGGKHLMFMNLKQQLVKGDIMIVTLNFAKSGTVDVKFPVKKAGEHKH